MRIVFLTMNSFSKFVTYKRAVGMGEALAKLGHQVYIVAFNCQENRERMQVEAPHCIPLWYDAKGIFLEVVQKLMYLRKICPDYVYSSVYSIRNLSGLQLFYPKRTKSILEFCELYSAIGKHKRRWAKLENMALGHYDMFVCASNYLERNIRARLSERVANKPVVYLPYAYPKYLQPKKREAAFPKRVLFMASLWRGYGVFEVLESLAKVLASGVDARLDVIGKGPILDEARCWVSDRKLEDKIILHGYVAEDALNEYMNQADVFVSPMHDTIQDWARCPSKLYYYLPYNKPIVTCRIGDPYDTLGEQGYYYAPGDDADMANVLSRAIAECDQFSYTAGFIAQHSWRARAIKFAHWCENCEIDRGRR